MDLHAVNRKLEDLTVKRLTRGNKTMQKLFAEAAESSTHAIASEGIAEDSKEAE